MRKLYGNQIRKEAGLTKTLKSAAIAIPNALPDKFHQEVNKLMRETSELQAAVSTTKNVERIVKEMVEKVEKTAEETAGAVGDMVEAARPRLQEVLNETRALLESSRSRLIPLVANNMDAYDLSLYSVKINHQEPFTLGQPIQVDWNAPANHGARDWIGVYKVTANKHTHITNISSRGLWHWTTVTDDEAAAVAVAEASTGVATTVENPKLEGTLVFKGNQLPWQVGTYEFRYHHDGKHNVMARSAAFEIVGKLLISHACTACRFRFSLIPFFIFLTLSFYAAPKAPSVHDKDSVQRCLLRLVQNALGNDAERMPVTPVDEYIGMGETEGRHIAYAIKLMYGVEFAWEIILGDKTVARLTRRVSLAILYYCVRV